MSYQLGDYDNLGFLTQLWSDAKKQLEQGVKQLQSNVQRSLEAEKDRVLTTTLTNASQEAQRFITNQAQRLISDPSKVQQVKDTATAKISEQIAKQLETPVRWAIDNPKKAALITAGIIAGIIAIMTLAGRGAVVSVAKKG